MIGILIYTLVILKKRKSVFYSHELIMLVFGIFGTADLMLLAFSMWAGKRFCCSTF